MKSTKRAVTPLSQKLALIGLGLILSFIVLEASMRLAGSILISIQDAQNRRRMGRLHSFTILCVGESTTQNAYPAFLEKLLNDAGLGLSFSVIDKGLMAVKTDFIIERLEPLINQYRPAMIVSMMGINDREGFIPWQRQTKHGLLAAIKSLKTYKLSLMIRLHLRKKLEELNENRLIAQLNNKYPGSRKASRAERLQDIKALVESGWGFITKKQYRAAEACFNKAIDTCSGTIEADEAYIGLGNIYKAKADYGRAQSCFKKAIELNPRNPNTHLGLCWLYKRTRNYELCEKAFKRLLELYPRHETALQGLSWVYFDMGKHGLSERCLRQLIKYYPSNDVAYGDLAVLYREKKKFSAAKRYCKKAIRLKPDCSLYYLCLQWIYLQSGNKAKAEDCSGKLMELMPDSDIPFAARSFVYGQTGDPELALGDMMKAQAIRTAGYVPMTVRNYRKLQSITAGRNIMLVAAQYPMRDIAPLKKTLESHTKNIIFVDNDKVFRDAVAKDGYGAYFTDIFAGDFGHCTEKGNRLLAQNIADTIIREYFKK